MGTFANSFKSLFEINMGVRKGERIVVFADLIRADEQPSPEEAERRQRLLRVAEAAADYAREAYGSVSFVSFPATASSGSEPPEVLWRAAMSDAIVDNLSTEGLLSKLLLKEASAADLDRAGKLLLNARRAVADVIIALANNSTSHTRFRALVNAAGGRFASLPHFDPDMFFTSMQVDWLALAERTRRLGIEVNQADEIVIETPNGTHMRFDKRGRKAEGDDGLLTAPGSFGNLPAGEVYLAPREGKSSGVMVIEYAPTRKLAAPLKLTVENGNVTQISGDDPYRQHLELKFSESPKNRNIAELGIGTNDRATRPDNILEAEKILGTIHIALGDNSGFGGKVQTPFHEDYIFYQPTVDAIMPDGSKKTLLVSGKPVF